jgi:hypothetical protein
MVASFPSVDGWVIAAAMITGLMHSRMSSREHEGAPLW